MRLRLTLAKVTVLVETSRPSELAVLLGTHGIRVTNAAVGDRLRVTGAGRVDVTS